MTSRVKIVAGFSIVCLVWGTTWSAVRLGLQTVPPILSAALRFGLASIVLGLWIKIKKIPFLQSKEFWTLVCIVCATAYSVPVALVYWGQSQIASGLASIVFATFPFWVIILSSIFLPEERIDFFHSMAVVLGFLGVLLIFHNGFTQPSSNLILGMLAVLTSALIQSSTLIALRKFRQQYNPIVLNFWSMLISTILLLLFSLMVESYSTVVFNPLSVASLLYLGTIGTVVSFVGYFWLAKHVEAVLLSLISFITPVVAIGVGVLLMGEHIDRETSLGAVIVLSAIVIANIRGIHKLLMKGKSWIS